MTIPAPTTAAPLLTYAPEDCPFPTVLVDVTHRCNMACHNCYVPNRTIPDLDAAWLEDIFARLPLGTYVRRVGGEPTLRNDLPRLIRFLRRHKQHPILLTNGLKLADRSYVRELDKAGIQIVYLSLNGAFDDSLYQAIDAMACADRKRQAFDNLRDAHLFTSLGMIIVRNLNESAVAAIWDAAQLARNVREVKLRSVGSIGRHMHTSPLSLAELMTVFIQQTGVSPATIHTHERTATSHDFIVGRIRVQLTQWPDLDSPHRGRLTQDGRIAPFFEHVMQNEGGY